MGLAFQNSKSAWSSLTRSKLKEASTSSDEGLQDKVKSIPIRRKETKGLNDLEDKVDVSEVEYENSIDEKISLMFQNFKQILKRRKQGNKRFPDNRNGFWLKGFSRL